VRFRRAAFIVFFVFLGSFTLNWGLARAATALFVTPRTSISPEHLQEITYSIRISLQAHGVTLAPEISTILGSLQAKQYVTFSSTPAEVSTAEKEIGVDSIILVDITKCNPDGVSWSLWEFLLVIPWLWHPFGIYDFAEIGVHACVFNSQGERIFSTIFMERQIGGSFLPLLLFDTPVAESRSELFTNTALKLANVLSSAVLPYLGH